MFSHLGRLVLGVENSQLSEHAHVSPFQTQGSLKEGDELVEEATVLVVVDEVLELVCMHDNVQTTDLSETELLRVHTRKADLQKEKMMSRDEHTKGEKIAYAICTILHRLEWA